MLQRFLSILQVLSFCGVKYSISSIVLDSDGRNEGMLKNKHYNREVYIERFVTDAGTRGERTVSAYVMLH